MKKIIKTEPERRQRLLELSRSLRERLVETGLAQSKSASQIVPILIGDARRALHISRRLEDHGLLVPAIRPPSVPKGTSRLRVSLTAGLDGEDVENLIRALVRVSAESS